MDEEQYTIKRKLLSKSIIITIYISFIGYLLGDIQSIANWNYNLHEMLYIPLNIAYFLLPLQFLAWIYYAIRSYGGKKDYSTARFKLYVKNSVIVMSLLLIFMYFFIQSHRVSTSGVFEVKNKMLEERNYYILISDKKVKCSWNEYNLIEKDKSYLIIFVWNSYWPDQGKLEYIEIVK